MDSNHTVCLWKAGHRHMTDRVYVQQRVSPSRVADWDTIQRDTKRTFRNVYAFASYLRGYVWFRPTRNESASFFDYDLCLFLSHWKCYISHLRHWRGYNRDGKTFIINRSTMKPVGKRLEAPLKGALRAQWNKSVGEFPKRRRGSVMAVYL